MAVRYLQRYHGLLLKPVFEKGMMMEREEAGKILAALVICGSNHRSCAECPAYDTEAGRGAQQRACSELLSEENVNTALEIMRR